MFEDLDPKELALWSVLIGLAIGSWSYLSMDPSPQSKTERARASSHRPDVGRTTDTFRRDGTLPGGETPAEASPTDEEQGEEGSERGSPGDDESVRAEENRSTGGTVGAKPSMAAPLDAGREGRTGPSDTGTHSSAKRRALRKAVKRSVEQVEPELRKCYDNLIDEFPGADGTVATTFELESGEQGVNVASINEGTTLFDRQLHECLLENVTELSVDVPWDEHFADTGTLAITYPFNFETASPDVGP